MKKEEQQVYKEGIFDEMTETDSYSKLTGRKTIVSKSKQILALKENDLHEER